MAKNQYKPVFISPWNHPGALNCFRAQNLWLYFTHVQEPEEDCGDGAAQSQCSSSQDEDWGDGAAIAPATYEPAKMARNQYEPVFISPWNHPGVLNCFRAQNLWLYFTHVQEPEEDWGDGAAQSQCSSSQDEDWGDGAAIAPATYEPVLESPWSHPCVINCSCPRLPWSNLTHVQEPEEDWGDGAAQSQCSSSQDEDWGDGAAIAPATYEPVFKNRWRCQCHCVLKCFCTQLP